MENSDLFEDDSDPSPDKFIDDLSQESLQPYLDADAIHSAPVSIFLPGNLRINELIAIEDPDLFLKAAAASCSEGVLFSNAQCFKLVSMLIKFIPILPRPQIQHDREEITIVLEYLWHTAIERQCRNLALKCGYYYSRWEDHHLRFEHEREILSVMLKIKNDCFTDIATCSNNIGVSWMFQKNMETAIPWLRKGAELYQKAGNFSEVCNSQLNEIYCHYEIQGQKYATDNILRHLVLAGDYLSGQKDPRSRKAYNLLARIFESRKDFSRAYRYSVIAANASHDTHTIYETEDKEYCEALKKAMDQNDAKCGALL
jgi:hypothetical protein